MNKVSRNFSSDDSGAVAVYVAIALVVLMGFAALALDIAHMVSVKRELAKAAEAGALSGARALWPMVLPVDNNETVTPNCTNAENIAKLAAQKNRVEGRNLAGDSEITVAVGRWDFATNTFTPGTSVNANGVRVTTSRADVNMILAQVLGQGSRNMSANAIAVMDYASCLGEGCIPIAVNNDEAFDSNNHVKNIDIRVRMIPDITDNAGWFVVPPNSASAAQLKDYIDNGTCPMVGRGIRINLQNGADGAVLQALQAKFNQCKAADGTWTVGIPTVATLKFGQDDDVVNTVGLKITKVVTTTDDKQVFGHLVNIAEVGKGLPGGTKGGVLAPPKLVQ
jgi:Flp pilus assembly protein TadG